MKEDFPSLAKEIDFQEVPEAQRVPKKLDPRKHTPRHIIIKLPKVKDKENLKSSMRKGDSYLQKVPIRLSADFSKETLQARRGWKEVFKVMNGKDLHPRLLYPAKLSFRMEGKIKCFSDKVKLKEFIITKPLLYEMLKGVCKKKMIKNISSKMTTISQLLKMESKKQIPAKKTTRTGMESQKWRSQGGLSVGSGSGEIAGEVYRE